MASASASQDRPARRRRRSSRDPASRAGGPLSVARRHRHADAAAVQVGGVGGEAGVPHAPPLGLLERPIRPAACAPTSLAASQSALAACRISSPYAEQGQLGSVGLSWPDVHLGAGPLPAPQQLAGGEQQRLPPLRADGIPEHRLVTALPRTVGPTTLHPRSRSRSMSSCSPGMSRTFPLISSMSASVSILSTVKAELKGPTSSARACPALPFPARSGRAPGGHGGLRMTILPAASSQEGLTPRLAGLSVAGRSLRPDGWPSPKP